ncbi:MAG: HlyD family secretion protein [Gammaproteobacteria bacterium]
MATPVSHQVWGVAAAGLSVAILLWLFLGHYTQRERVTGTLVPQAGLLNITARDAGTVTKVAVSEGAQVRAGAPLLTISSDRNSASMGDTSAAINTQLGKQRNKLQSDLVDTRAVAKEQAVDLHMQQRMLRTQIGQLNAQLVIEQDEAGKLSHLLRRFQTLVGKGYVSALQVQEQREQVSSAETEMDELERERSQAEQQLASVGDQLVELPPSTSAKLNGLQQQLAQIQQALIQNAAAWADILRAPATGTVSAVLIEPGQAVQPGQALVTIMPKWSLLQAQLLVPSSAIGFVHIGTPVVLHYQAFPYQKFGVRRGTVVNVSRSALTPAELTALLGQAPPPAPLYRVEVELASQSIEAYGKPHALLPGMSLNADLLLDRRRMIQWIFEPLYGVAKRDGKT